MPHQLLITLLLSASCLALDLSQIDDFQDGTTENWIIGNRSSPLVPFNVPNAGPNGTGDNALQYASNGGNSTASRMVFFNRQNQWVGNYFTAGIDAIQLDIKNLGPTALNLRWAISSGVGGENGPWVASTHAVAIPADNTWRTVVLPVRPSDLTSVFSNGDPATILANARATRLLSSASPDFIGDEMIATIQVDNIQPIALPDPPLIEIEQTSSSSVDLFWQGLSGLTYQIETSSTLEEDDWTESGSPIAGNDQEIRQTFSTASSPLFFRVSIPIGTSGSP
ncbi:MAG: hypothetical protein AAGC74_07885 [Verrucomicrobiota bacterium]